MRVLLSSDYDYLGMDDSLYIFIAKVGIEKIITDQLKFVDKENGNVIFFLKSEDGRPNIQYSYKTSERIKMGLALMSDLGFAIRTSKYDVLPREATSWRIQE